MSHPSKCSSGQVTAGASLVIAINATGAIVLWDREDMQLHILRCRNLSPQLRNRILENRHLIVAFLAAQAHEQAP